MLARLPLFPRWAIKSLTTFFFCPSRYHLIRLSASLSSLNASPEPSPLLLVPFPKSCGRRSRSLLARLPLFPRWADKAAIFCRRCSMFDAEESFSLLSWPFPSNKDSPSSIKI